MSNIREPIKKTSIKKKNIIIEKGFELMCEKGYHKVSCIDIAKYAGVSTGIIYQYFKNKRDIFIYGVRNYYSNIMNPLVSTLENKKITKENLKKLINKMINEFVKVHNSSKKAHEELVAMSSLDKEVAKIFIENEIETTEKLSMILEINGFNIDNLYEKVHLIYGIIDNYCHEIVYHKHKELNYKIMKKIIINEVYNILDI